MEVLTLQLDHLDDKSAGQSLEIYFQHTVLRLTDLFLYLFPTRTPRKGGKWVSASMPENVHQVSPFVGEHVELSIGIGIPKSYLRLGLWQMTRKNFGDIFIVFFDTTNATNWVVASVLTIIRKDTHNDGTVIMSADILVPKKVLRRFEDHRIVDSL